MTDGSSQEQSIPEKQIIKLKPGENHDGIDFNSPLQDTALSRIREIKNTLPTPSLHLLNSVISNEIVDIENQRDEHPWKHAQDFFKRDSNATNYIAESDGTGPPTFITRDTPDPFANMINNRSDLVKTVVAMSSHPPAKNITPNQIDDLLKYIKHNQKRWENKSSRAEVGSPDNITAQTNIGTFTHFEEMVTGYQLESEIETYLQDTAGAEEKIEEKEMSSPHDHPYLRHMQFDEGSSPKRDEMIEELKQKLKIGETLSFSDFITILQAEQDDLRDQFQLFNNELTTADNYFNTNSDASEVPLYIYSDGNVSTDEDTNKEAKIVARRIYEKKDMDELKETRDIWRRRSGGDGSSLWMKEGVRGARTILENRDLDDSLRTRLVKLINQKTNKTQGKIRDSLESLRTHAELYVGPQKVEE